MTRVLKRTQKKLDGGRPRPTNNNVEKRERGINFPSLNKQTLERKMVGCTETRSRKTHSFIWEPEETPKLKQRPLRNVNLRALASVIRKTWSGGEKKRNRL